jgi:hypothetical protein
MGEISAIGIVGELVFATNDFIDGLKKCYDEKKFPEADTLFAKASAVMTFVGYLSKYGTQLGIGGGALSLFSLENDNDKLVKAIQHDDFDNIIIYGLSVVSDVASIVAAIPIPQTKIIAISIVATATASKELYANRKQIAFAFSVIKDKFNNFAARYKNDPKVYLNLPNSAIRCHVVNGLNMNRGLTYHGAFSQNRLDPHWWVTAVNQHRTPTQRPLTANEMRIKQQLVSHLQEHPYLDPNFEWKKPGVFELRTNRKK